MVSERHRRRGIGTALLREAEEWARTVGVRKLELHVFPHNDAAIAALRELWLPPRGPAARPLPPRRGVRRRGADGARRPLDSASGLARPDRGQLLQAARSRPRPLRAGQARRGGPARARPRPRGQAGFERRAVRALPRGDRRPGGRRARAEPLSGRRRLPASDGPRRAARRSPRGSRTRRRRRRCRRLRSRRSRSSPATRSSAAGRASPAM